MAIFTAFFLLNFLYIPYSFFGGGSDMWFSSIFTQYVSILLIFISLLKTEVFNFGEVQFIMFFFHGSCFFVLSTVLSNPKS